MTDLYAVMGNPINHSKSPQIHAEFAKQTQQELIYSAMLVPVGNFDMAVKDFFKGSGKGLNVTVPFKEKAFRFADQLTPRAKSAQAVNTLKLCDNGTIIGDNTDGVGLVQDLTANLGVVIEGKRLLILGAGGAVRGVLKPLLAENPRSITIANRTVSKAEQLAYDFAELGNVDGCGFHDLIGSFDLIINGTSASLQGELAPIEDETIAPNTQVYDMMYGAEPTKFMTWAMQRGCQNAYDGLGMLVEQAAESFALWRGTKPNTKDVIADIRSQLRPVKTGA